MADVGMTYEQIQAVQAQFRGQAANLESLIRQISGQVESLAGAGWSGQAYTQFQTTMTSWNRDTQSVTNDLNNINSLMTTAMNNMQETDSSGARLFNRG